MCYIPTFSPVLPHLSRHLIACSPCSRRTRSSLSRQKAGCSGLSYTKVGQSFLCHDLSSWGAKRRSSHPKCSTLGVRAPGELCCIQWLRLLPTAWLVQCPSGPWGWAGGSAALQCLCLLLSLVNQALKESWCGGQGGIAIKLWKTGRRFGMCTNPNWSAPVQQWELHLRGCCTQQWLWGTRSSWLVAEGWW